MTGGHVACCVLLCIPAGVGIGQHDLLIRDHLHLDHMHLKRKAELSLAAPNKHAKSIRNRQAASKTLNVGQHRTGHAFVAGAIGSAWPHDTTACIVTDEKFECRMLPAD